jgi:hypothetical protein
MKGRKKRATGGVDMAEEDEKSKPEARTNAPKIDKEAEELKKGGRAKRAHGGKMVGKVHGEKAPAHAGRKPRKAGGRTGSEASPFTGANKGKEPAGHKTMGPDPVIAGEDQRA